MTTYEFNGEMADRVGVTTDRLAAGPSRSQRRRPRGSGRRRALLLMVNVLLVLVCLGTGMLTLGNAAGWWRTDTVLTGSMRPGIQPGDVEILRPESTRSLSVGQIVAFHPPRDSFTVSHRVVALRRDHGTTWIKTRGDANNVSDPWGSVRVAATTVWTVREVVPRIGYLSVWARTPLLHLLLVLAIVLSGCGLALQAIWRQ